MWVWATLAGPAALVLLACGWIAASARAQARKAAAAVAMQRRFGNAGCDQVGQHSADPEEGQPGNQCRITVPELVRRARAAGDALRLNWPNHETLPFPVIDRDDYPTAILPAIRDD